jgi:hypothetical protein
MTLPAMAPRFPELQDAGWLRRRYEVEGLSSYAIAVELGCRANSVSRALRRHGITARMGRPAVVAPGQVYGRLTVLGELPERTRGGRVFRCRCTCGRETDARAVELRQGKVRSCGCLLDEARQSSHTRPSSVRSGQRYGRLAPAAQPTTEQADHQHAGTLRRDPAHPNTGLIVPLDTRPAETEPTGGDLRPSENHPRPTRPGNLNPNRAPGP